MSVSKMKKRVLEDEGRVYQEKNGKTCFFSVLLGKTLCLVCSKAVSGTKEYNLRRHDEILHKVGVLEGKLRGDK
jgi:hypothetical protein